MNYSIFPGIIVLAILYLAIGVRGSTNSCNPRDLTAAKLAGHACQNGCSTKSDCFSSARKCVCDGFCGKSCVRTRMKCKRLADPPNGKVHHSPSLRFNAVVTYLCDRGYTLIGQVSRVCRGDGKWDYKEPVCKNNAAETFGIKDTLPKKPLSIRESTSIIEDMNKETTSSLESGVTAFENPQITNQTMVTATIDIASTASNKGIYIGAGAWDLYETPQTEPTDLAGSASESKEEVEIYKPPPRFGSSRECAEPPTVENSNMDGRNPNYPIGSEIKYKCSHGFFATAENRDFKIIVKTQCVFDEAIDATHWTSLNVICRKKSCADPGDILHGSRIGHIFIVGYEVVYKCDEGYEIVGRSTIFCTPTTRWTRRPPKCRPVKCPALEEFENGVANYDSVEYLSVVSYSCSKSYTLIGNKERTCLADKTWSGKTPLCQAVLCEPPEHLPYGKINVGPGPITEGYIISFQCDKGKILVGSFTSRCLSSGVWSFGIPLCKATCISRSVANGDVFVHNAKLESDETTTDHDEEQVLKCDKGYQVSNTFERSYGLICNDGNWFPVDECMPASCNMFRISYLRPSGARLIDSLSTAMADHNERVEAKCRSTHAPSTSQDYALVCQFGKWTWENDQELKCSPRECIIKFEDITRKNLKNLFDGKTVSHGEILDIHCKYGYKFESDVGEIKCRYGRFNAEIPRCRPKRCNSVNIKNGNWIADGDHGAIRQVQCFDEYVIIGIASITCEYGSWMPSIPSCVKATEPKCSNSFCKNTFQQNHSSSYGVFCSYHPSEHRNVFTDVNGGRTVKRTLKIPSGTTVKSRCKNKTFFKPISGSSKSICNNGSWINDKPLSCRNVTGGDIVTPFYAKHPDSFLHSADGTIIMKEGNPLELTCYIKFSDIVPVWSTTAGERSFVRIAGSSRVYSIHRISSRHAGKYSCYKSENSHFGFAVQVVNEFRCQREVPWKSAGLVVTFDEKLSRANFSCQEGYNLEGDTSVHCNKMYYWESQNPPHCVWMNRCQKPDIESTSSLIMSPAKDFYSLGEKVSFSCEENLELKGSHFSIQCTLNGWNNDAPTCAKGCPKPIIPENSNLFINIDKDLYSIAERLTFFCKNNYTIEGTYQVMCLSDGWNHAVPTCIPNEEEG